MSTKADASLGIMHQAPERNEMREPMSFEQAIFKNVWNKGVHVPNVLMGEAGPIRKIDRRKTEGPIPFHMERLEYARRLKMLSLNPCVYGNIYGVLGSS